MAVKTRLTISAAYNDFIIEVQRLIKFNASNLTKFNNGQLTVGQIDLLVESVFFNCFRNYENFLRESFLLCCTEKISKRPKVRSYLKAKNFEHSEQLIKSTSPFLDWADPEKLISRAELFLENGHPIKQIIITRKTSLKEFKKIRNHIAHDSNESQIKFENVLQAYHGYLPVNIPSVGEHLRQPSKNNPAQILLEDFFQIIKDIAADLVR